MTTIRTDLPIQLTLRGAAPPGAVVAAPAWHTSGGVDADTGADALVHRRHDGSFGLLVGA